MRTFKFGNDSGFTIVELMIVLAIIAILAAIAIPQYRKFQLRAKVTEAKVNIASIRTLEESFGSEHNVFVACASTPRQLPGPKKKKWPNIPNNVGFSLIGFKPAGDVYFSYSVRLGDTGPIHGGINYNHNGAMDANGNFNQYVTDYRYGIVDITIYATGDLDGDKNYATFYSTDEDVKIKSYPPGAGKYVF